MNELDAHLTTAFFDALEKCERDPAETAKRAARAKIAMLARPPRE